MSYEKAVKGATKLKIAAPKSKYTDVILEATDIGNQALMETCRALNNRVGDSSWTVSFKALIVLHLMFRNGAREATLKFLAQHRRTIDFSSVPQNSQYGEVMTRYAAYLHQRVKEYSKTKIDYVKPRAGSSMKHKLRTITVEKGLLWQVESVQSQVNYLLKVKFLPEELSNDISLAAFRLLIADLLSLYQTLNEGVINVLEHYFEMSKFDVERALDIYKRFVASTDSIVDYLQVGKRLESVTGVSVPNLRHAPTSLTRALEDYLNDPNFDVNHRQYLAEKEARQNGESHSSISHIKKSLDNSNSNRNITKSASPLPQSITNHPENTSNDSNQSKNDLIDFFDSIEPPSMPSLKSPEYVTTNPTGFAPTNPYANAQQTNFNQQLLAQPTNSIYQQQQQQQPNQVSIDFTGAGFGGYSNVQNINTFSNPQPQLQQQTTGANPFRLSMNPTGFIPDPNANVQPQIQSSTGFMNQSQKFVDPSLNNNPFQHNVQRTQTMPALTATPTGISSLPPISELGAFNVQQQQQQQQQQLQQQQQQQQQLLQQQAQQQQLQQQQQQLQQQPLQQQYTFTPSPATALTHQSTGINPFSHANTISSFPQSANSGTTGVHLNPQQTGSNPFRASTNLGDTNTGSQTLSFGGLENLQTVQIFPRR